MVSDGDARPCQSARPNQRHRLHSARPEWLDGVDGLLHDPRIRARAAVSWFEEKCACGAPHLQWREAPTLPAAGWLAVLTRLAGGFLTGVVVEWPVRWGGQSPVRQHSTNRAGGRNRRRVQRQGSGRKRTVGGGGPGR